jgi:hypothetical protein
VAETLGNQKSSKRVPLLGLIQTSQPSQQESTNTLSIELGAIDRPTNLLLNFRGRLGMNLSEKGQKLPISFFGSHFPNNGSSGSSRTQLFPSREGEPSDHCAYQISSSIFRSLDGGIPAEKPLQWQGQVYKQLPPNQVLGDQHEVVAPGVHRPIYENALAVLGGEKHLQVSRVHIKRPNSEILERIVPYSQVVA